MIMGLFLTQGFIIMMLVALYAGWVTYKHTKDRSWIGAIMSGLASLFIGTIAVMLTLDIEKLTPKFTPPKPPIRAYLTYEQSKHIRW
jgi:hypothetical protein